eukprot:SAG22_NODE_346_length_11892_cov_40.205970_6_plen_1014_part_01
MPAAGNTDGNIDLYVYSSVRWGAASDVVNTMFWGNGTGGFVEETADDFALHRVGQSSTSSAQQDSTSKALSFDLNYDGALDIYLASGGRMRLFAGNNGGKFVEQLDSPLALPSDGTGARITFNVADFTGDTHADVYVWGNSHTLMVGDGTGQFEKTVEANPFVEGSIRTIQAADINSDGIADLYLNDWFGNNILLLGSEGCAGSTTYRCADPNHLGSPCYLGYFENDRCDLTAKNTNGWSGHAAIGDLNGDGHNDLISEGDGFLPGSTQVFFFRRCPTGFVARPTQWTAPDGDDAACVPGDVILQTREAAEQACEPRPKCRGIFSRNESDHTVWALCYDNQEVASGLDFRLRSWQGYPPPEDETAAPRACWQRSAAPDLDWVELNSGVGTMILDSDYTQGSDDGWYDVDLTQRGWCFAWYSKCEDTVSIGSNGLITFGTAHLFNGESQPIPCTTMASCGYGTQAGGDSLSYDTAVNGAIAPLWADLNPGGSADGNVFYAFYPSSIVIEWDHVVYWTSSPRPDCTVTFAATLSAVGDVKMSYAEMCEEPLSSASIGFEDHSGHRGEQLSLGDVPQSMTGYFIPAACHAGARGTSFEYSDTPRTFEDAVDFCFRNGGTIASVHSEAEKEMVAAVAPSSNFYIGAHWSIDYASLYVGCFVDDWLSPVRDLPSDTPALTGSSLQGRLDQCAQQCDGFQYMGLQWINECFCGNSYGSLGESPSCVQCGQDGATGESCGNRNEVYHVPTSGVGQWQWIDGTDWDYINPANDGLTGAPDEAMMSNTLYGAWHVIGSRSDLHGVVCRKALDCPDNPLADLTTDPSACTSYPAEAPATVSPVVLLQFASDSSVPSIGFEASFTCVDAPPQDPCIGGEGASLVDSGSIAFDGQYSNNHDCRWLLSCSDVSLAPRLSFSSFATEGGRDFVNVFDGPTPSDTRLANYHGADIPNATSATGATMLLQFTSDGSVTADGFHVTFVCDTPGDPPPSHPCTTGRELVDSGVIDFTGGYDNGHDCRWTLRC